ncbi:protein-glutamine gamma-glutamyltransferase K-like [Octopus sinensis]|uniref:Protein-glutamine gamma-glutamyltransferase K-like n=1 Tax=Octopus sinensis TaxID=2607531 RepID=A0A6P7SCW1_9MOLL|nr:protein-glutamine gamma-glutamyltransferase K-like [Octopus sinensis]
MSSESPRPKRTRYSLRHSHDGSSVNGRTNAVSVEQYMKQFRHLREATSKSKETLKLLSLNLHPESNRKSHHTDEFDQKTLIVRRGSSFILGLTFHRKVIKEIDDIVLQFSVGEKPQESKGTLIRLKLFEDLRPRALNKVKRNKWIVKCLSIEGETIQVEVSPSVNSSVGNYLIFVETKNADEKDDEVERYLHGENFIMLFNPWCKDDTVYMENEKLLDEYILNETGRIWVGSSRFFRGRPWNFGQFQEPCLDVALLLLDKGGLSAAAKRDPVTVIRCLTAMTNSNDEDEGLIEGKWGNDYPEPSTRPSEWSGSTAIISQYAKTSKSVRYGQCWVFSGLMTTLLRAMGIPTRSVTNFQSAHDSNASITIDIHFDENSEPIDFLNDSIWNFHVWNESWLHRPDLPSGYDGWQAHDATPQESSDGLMRCGPCPVKAIKEGDVFINYDTPFIFSEVNGDKVFWKINSKTGEVKSVHIDKSAVGKFISTKAVGSVEREDITHLYKYKEGSQEERHAVAKACRNTCSEHEEIYGEVEDVSFEVVELKKAILGNSFTVGLKIHSKSILRTVETSFAVMTCFYTGVNDKRIFSQRDTVTVHPDKDTMVKLTLNPEDYESKINSDGTMSIFIVAEVKETGQTFVDEHNIVVEKPALILKCPDSIKHGDAFDLTIQFTNPLKREMTNVVYHIEGSGVRKSFEIREEASLQPGAETTKVVEIYAYKYGSREIIVTLSSDNLDDINGSVPIRVKYSA